MEEKDIPKTYWDVVDIYLRDKCTGHGFPRCRSGPTMGSPLRRTVWLFIALGFSGYCIWQLYDAVTDYYRYPSLTSIEVEQPGAVLFPSVSICPLAAVVEASALNFTLEKQNDSFVWPYPNEPEKPYWNPLIQNMAREDDQIKIIKKLHEHVMNKYEAQQNVTVEEMVNHLGIADKLNISHRLAYVKELQKLRRVSQGLEPVPVNGSVWTNDNAGQFLDWLNDTWNGNYFDIQQYMISRYGNAANSSQMTDDYFSAILTRNMDHFRMSLRSGNQFPKSLVDLANDLETTGLFSTNDPDPGHISKETMARFILQRFRYPFTFRQFDVVQGCFFQDTTCKGQIYTSFHPKWKTCYHFNNEHLNILNEQQHAFQIGTNKNRNEPLRIQAAGKGSGLNLQLRMTARNESLLPMLDVYGGYLIAIGDSATMPRWDMHVIIPKAGRSDISLKRTEITRLDAENGGNCKSEDFFAQVFPEYKIVGVYDRSICRQLVVFFSILNQCNCLMSIDIMGGIVGIEDMALKYRGCSYDTMPCVEYASNLAFESALDRCPPACHEVIVDVSVTSTSPSAGGNMMSEVAWNWLDQPARLRVMEESDPEIVKNAEYAFVNIFYDSPNVNVINEELIYTPYEFVANLGGIVGLYIGMSLVSVVEVMELLLDLFNFHRRRGRKVPIKVNVEEFLARTGCDKKCQKQLSEPPISLIASTGHQQSTSSKDLVSIVASIKKDVSNALQMSKKQEAEIMDLKNAQENMEKILSKLLGSIKRFTKQRRVLLKVLTPEALPGSVESDDLDMNTEDE